MKETELKIRVFGESVLRVKSVPVKNITDQHRDILSKMAQLMYASGGIGLAAPQVGINQAIIVVDIGQGLYKLVNPEIIKREGTQVTEEGCLSVPGVCIKVKRAKKIVLKAKDELAKPFTIEAQGLLACVFQHEIDHLKGKLIVDYASLLEHLRIRKKLDQLAKKAQSEPSCGYSAKNKAKDEGSCSAKTKSCKLQL